MNTIYELSDYIKRKIGTGTSRQERDRLRAVLAKEISENSEMAFLLLAKSGFTPDESIILQKVNEIMSKKETQNFVIDPVSMKGDEDQFGGSDFPDWEPIATPEQEAAINRLYAYNPVLNNDTSNYTKGSGLTDGFDKDAPWIQTYSGRRFNPTNPNPEAIVIQDIAHALSMQCRFSGHCREFYSVAQHSVLVSHICGFENALWGLLHDASEAYLVDMPRPLKRSGKLDAFIEFEHKVQEAVCKRFGLPEKEPPDVKRADTILLATEARDLMSPRHPDWKQPAEPLPFKIESWSPQQAKDNFLKRFTELTSLHSK